MCFYDHYEEVVKNQYEEAFSWSEPQLIFLVGTSENHAFILLLTATYIWITYLPMFTEISNFYLFCILFFSNYSELLMKY